MILNVLDVVAIVNYILNGEEGFPVGCADVTGDGAVNVLDIVILVNFIIGTDSPTNPEFNAADMNNDNILNVLDIVLLVNLILG